MPRWDRDASCLQISWTGEPGFRYTVEGSDDLRAWRPLDLLFGVGDPIVFKPGQADPVSYLRVVTADAADPIDAVPLFDAARDGYPERLTDVPEPQIERDEALLDGAAARFADGETLDEIEVWLRSQVEVAEVYRSRFTIAFRPEGSPPMFIHDGVGARSVGETVEEPPVLDSSAVGKSGSLPGVADRSKHPRVGQLIVGQDRDGDGRRDFAKRLLILSPFASEFAPYNPARSFLRFAPETAELINDHTDILEDELVRLEHFADWSGYDLIHVSTHGDRVSAPDEDGKLRLQEILFVRQESKEAFKSYLKNPANEHLDTGGIFPGRVSVRDGVMVRATVITPRWMEAQSNTKLDRKVILLDACKSGAGAFLPLLTGEHSASMGWDGYVRAGHSFTLSYLLYQHTLEFALPLRRSLEIICEKFECRDEVNKSSPVINFTGADLRLVEMVSILDPATGLPSYDPGVSLERATIWCPEVVDALVGSGADPAVLHSQVYPVLQIRGLEPENLVNYAGDAASTLKFNYFLQTELDGVPLGEILAAGPGPVPVPGADYAYRFEVPFPGISLQRNLLVGEVIDLGFSLRMPAAQKTPGNPAGGTFFGRSFPLPVSRTLVDTCCGLDTCELPLPGALPVRAD